jgi:hypothetical protein
LGKLTLPLSIAPGRKGKGRDWCEDRSERNCKKEKLNFKGACFWFPALGRVWDKAKISDTWN